MQWHQSKTVEKCLRGAKVLKTVYIPMKFVCTSFLPWNCPFFKILENSQSRSLHLKIALPSQSGKKLFRILSTINSIISLCYLRDLAFFSLFFWIISFYLRNEIHYCASKLIRKSNSSTFFGQSLSCSIFFCYCF